MSHDMREAAEKGMPNHRGTGCTTVHVQCNIIIATSVEWKHLDTVYYGVWIS